MASFNLTTSPKSLSLKPGQSGSIVVVASNRLGRPFLARLDPKVTPETAQKWVTPQAGTPVQFGADPQATRNFEFTVKVPDDAQPQVVQFHANVVDPQIPDDPLEEGPTVEVNVLAKDAPMPKPNGVKIPWWVWPIAAVVVIGIGVGIYFIVKPTGVPNVVNRTAEEATGRLLGAGFDSVVVRDTVVDDAEIDRVVFQDPDAGGERPPEADSAVATIAVNRPPTTVPPVLGLTLAQAAPQLSDSGLRIGSLSDWCTTTASQNDLVARVTPDTGRRVPRGSEVSVATYRYAGPGQLCFSIVVGTYRGAELARQMRTRAGF